MTVFEIISEQVPAFEVLNTVANYNISEASLPTKVVCPFHHDNTPSLNVYPGNKGTYCFGCGRSYSSYDIVQKILHLKHYETIKWFEKNYKLDLSTVSDDEDTDNTEGSVDEDIAYYIEEIKKSRLSVPKKFQLVSMSIDKAIKGDFTRLDKVLKKVQK